MSSLLKEVVAEFTLTDNLASTTTSQLRSLCHEDDSILLGSWLEETDHKIVEEIVSECIMCCVLCIVLCIVCVLYCV